LVDLLKTKQAGVETKKTGAPVAERRVINLMDALRRSIEAEQPKKPAAHPQQHVADQRRDARRCAFVQISSA
jgi:non-homologous end joining protein Ku